MVKTGFGPSFWTLGSVLLTATSHCCLKCPTVAEGWWEPESGRWCSWHVKLCSCTTCRIPPVSLAPLSQNLHFDRICSWFECKINLVAHSTYFSSSLHRHCVPKWGSVSFLVIFLLVTETIEFVRVSKCWYLNSFFFIC